MISLNFDVFIFIFLTAGFLFIFALWFFYDWRDRDVMAGERAQSVYHCVKCGHLFAAPRNAETASCPNCQFQNAPLRF